MIGVFKMKKLRQNLQKAHNYNMKQLKAEIIKIKRIK